MKLHSTKTATVLALCAAPFLPAQTNPPTSTPAPAAATAPAAHATQKTPDAPAQANPNPSNPNPNPAAPAPATSQPMASTAAAKEPPHANIQLATDDAKDRTAKRMSGRTVRGSDGRDLGSVKDFLVDTQTGKLDFALVSSGGMAGIGNKLRLVPVGALQRSAQDKDFTLDVREAQWKTLATVDEGEFKSGEFILPDAQRRQIAQAFAPHQGAAASAFYSAGLTGHLMRASDLAGQHVHAGHEQFGRIDAVVLDFDAGTAQALVDPRKSFTGTRHQLLVPFSELAIDSGRRPRVTTLLTRADFQPPRGSNAGTSSRNMAAAPAQAVASNAPATPASSPQKSTAPQASPGRNAASAPPSAVAANDAKAAPRTKEDRPAPATRTENPSAAQNQNLTPTGQNSADAIPAGTDPALVSTARAVRKALDDNPALARLDVRVTPEDGRIVLRGRVSDQKTKTAVIEAATREIKSWKYDDQISIDNR